MHPHSNVKRFVCRIGDVFAVTIDRSCVKYLQYVANDRTQLASNVIRVFKKSYPSRLTPQLDDVVRGEVDFHAHCLVRLGVRLGVWSKVGHAAPVGDVDVLFRDTNDVVASPSGERVQVSHTWYVWHINDHEFTPVGRLTGRAKQAEIGFVIPPDEIVKRMKTGRYEFFCPL